MRRSGLVGLVVVVAAMAAMVGVSQAPARSAPEELPPEEERPIASCKGPWTISAVVGRGYAEAQTFTAAKGGRLTSVEVPVFEAQADKVYLEMQIRTVDASGEPTQTVLASATIPPWEIPIDPLEPVSDGVTAVFDPGAEVEAGRQYALVLNVIGFGFVVWRGSDVNPCSGRPYQVYKDGDVVPEEIRYDWYFSAFGTPSESDDTCTITGTRGDDELEGTRRADVICGLGGGDAISGRRGNDVLRGGPGVDAIAGGKGSDELYGERGVDSLDATDGVRRNDSMNGGGGVDACRGDRGDTKKNCG